MMKVLSPRQSPLYFNRPKKVLPDPHPSSVLLPSSQPSPAGRGAGIPFGQIAPAGSRLQDPEDSVDHVPVVDPGTAALAAARHSGQMWLDLGPLLVGQPNALSRHSEHLRTAYYQKRWKSTSSIS